MKLRNKKTGKVIKLDIHCIAGKNYESLSELNDEWEDYEEPKEYWFIDYDGGIVQFKRNKESATERMMKQFGNYFESQEEAEKAVERLRAWKRLKDNRFRFEGTNNKKRRSGYFINYYLGKSFNSQDECEQAMKDIDLLFGGEE